MGVNKRVSGDTFSELCSRPHCNILTLCWLSIAGTGFLSILFPMWFQIWSQKTYIYMKDRSVGHRRSCALSLICQGQPSSHSSSRFQHCSPAASKVEQRGRSFLSVSTFASWKLVCDPATNCKLSARVKVVASCSLRTVPKTSSVHHPQRLFLLQVLSEWLESLYVMKCVVFNVWTFHYLSSECFHCKKKNI